MWMPTTRAAFVCTECAYPLIVQMVNLKPIIACCAVGTPEGKDLMLLLMTFSRPRKACLIKNVQSRARDFPYIEAYAKLERGLIQFMLTFIRRACMELTAVCRE